MGAISSPLGAVATIAGSMMAKDSAEDSAETAADAANPHLWWQQQYALPYLEKVLAEAGNKKSPANQTRDRVLGELPGLMDMYKGLPDPKSLDRESMDYQLPALLRDQGIAELIDRGNNPMNYGTYQDREQINALQKTIMTNPVNAFLNGPYKEFFDKAGEQAIERSAAAKGQRNSGELLNDLGLFSGKNAMDTMQDVLVNLGTFASNRGTAYTNDQQEAYKNAQLGSDMIAELIKNLGGENQMNVGALQGRVESLGDMLNMTNASKQDPYFDKLVSLVGGNPAAAAQAITSGQQFGDSAMMGGLSRAGNLSAQAYKDYQMAQELGQPSIGNPVQTTNMAGQNIYDFGSSTSPTYYNDLSNAAKSYSWD